MSTSWRFAAILACGAVAAAYGCASGGTAVSSSDGAGGAITGATTGPHGSGPGSGTRTGSSSTGVADGGFTGSSGMSGTGGFTTSSSSSGSGGGVSCFDTDPEPDDDESSAYVLNGGNIMSCSDGDVGMQVGTLNGGLDEDWYTYQAEDTISCSPNPVANVQTTDGSLLELCVYLQCTDGGANVEVTCNGSSTPDTSLSQRPGCCATGEEVAPDINCTGTTDEGALVFMRVHDPSGAAVCTQYQLTWHY